MISAISWKMDQIPTGTPLTTFCTDRKRYLSNKRESYLDSTAWVVKMIYVLALELLFGDSLAQLLTSLQ